MAETPYPAAFVTYGWCRSAFTVVRSLVAWGGRARWPQLCVRDVALLAVHEILRSLAGLLRGARGLCRCSGRSNRAHGLQLGRVRRELILLANDFLRWLLVKAVA